MKKLLSIAVIAILLVACNDDAKKESETKSDAGTPAASTENNLERNKKIAMASLDGINSHNADAVLKDAAPDVVDYGDGTMTPTKNLDSLRAGLKGWMTAFPDIKGENLKAVAEGDWVMVWGDWSATWKGDYMGSKATGKSYKIKDVDIFRFNSEGKITEHHNIQPWISIASQIGMKMP